MNAEMTSSLNAADEAALGNLLNALELMDGDDEILELSASSGEPAVIDVVEPGTVELEDIETAVSRIEAQEAVSKAYGGEVSEGVSVPVELAEKPKKEKKAASTPRKYYPTKAAKAKEVYGGEINRNVICLEVDDFARTDEGLAELQSEILTVMNDAGKKVQNRMMFFMDFMAGKGSLNAVCRAAIEHLASKGSLVPGAFYEGLVAGGYSNNSAQAMGGNTIAAMVKLKIVKQVGKGMYEVNKNSRYYPALIDKLHLTKTAALASAREA
ncbi:hypothetical protein LJC19_07065 [Oxalobacter sp. OttesenSCG-928-P03]|nr:hypothetical protein [Oxalobacter sp. OttesenSCG-928-P03]